MSIICKHMWRTFSNFTFVQNMPPVSFSALFIVRSAGLSVAKLVPKLICIIPDPVFNHPRDNRTSLSWHRFSQLFFYDEPEAEGANNYSNCRPFTLAIGLFFRFNVCRAAIGCINDSNTGREGEKTRTKAFQLRLFHVLSLSCDGLLPWSWHGLYTPTVLQNLRIFTLAQEETQHTSTHRDKAKKPKISAERATNRCALKRAAVWRRTAGSDRETTLMEYFTLWLKADQILLLLPPSTNSHLPAKQLFFFLFFPNLLFLWSGRSEWEAKRMRFMIPRPAGEDTGPVKASGGGCWRWRRRKQTPSNGAVSFATKSLTDILVEGSFEGSGDGPASAGCRLQCCFFFWSLLAFLWLSFSPF